LYVEDGGAYVQTEDDAAKGETHYCKTHLAPLLKEEQDIWVYDTTLIDFNDYDLPKNYECNQKYIIISRAAKPDRQKVRKIKETKLAKNAPDYNDEDIEAVVEQYDEDFHPELEADEV